VSFRTPAEAALDAVYEDERAMHAEVVAAQQFAARAAVLVRVLERGPGDEVEHAFRELLGEWEPPDVVLVRCRRDNEGWFVESSSAGSGRSFDMTETESFGTLSGRTKAAYVEVVIDEQRSRVTPRDGGYWLWATEDMDYETFCRVTVVGDDGKLLVGPTPWHDPEDVDDETVVCPRCGTTVSRADAPQSGSEGIAFTQVLSTRRLGDDPDTHRSVRITFDDVLVHECGSDGAPR
jgi:hypothetical protein